MPSRFARYPSKVIGLVALIAAVTAAAQPSRITRVIDNRDRIMLRGHIHPKALPQYDQGRVMPSLRLSYVTLTLGQSDTQKADLERLLVEQQTPGSPNYHRWLTPEQFAQRFGPSDADIARITAWLQSQGLTVTSVARGRGWIAFDGSAAQVESAFGTQLHHYSVNNELHFANATEPSIPAALAGAVTAIRGLHDFHPKARAHRQSVTPDYVQFGTHYLAPGDIATIYDINALYSAGVNGSGQNLAVAGQTRVIISNVQLFRNNFNLPANDPQVMLVPASRDPGIVMGDVDEAHLDLEWAGAIARSAHIIYVYSTDVFTSTQYIIDQNLAPVVSASYGECEVEAFASDFTSLQASARQANAQGITWFAPSGDSGAADCNDSQNPGLSSDLPASIPEVTGLGGTQFQEGSGNYWVSSNSPTGGSTLSYIPEGAWNDSAAAGLPSATGGGASIFFAKPYWQSVPGVPGDNARHVPDVSLSASPSHDGYMIFTGGSLQGGWGGTSIPTPIFAGIAALLNQYLVSNGVQSTAGLGNINPTLYALSQAVPAAFHDVTTGHNIVTVPCPMRGRSGCVTNPVGYSASVGYDQITGLGSVDVYKLVTNWSNAFGATQPAGVGLAMLTSQTTVAANDAVDLIATVTDGSGATPSGIVQFTAGGVGLGSAQLTGSGGTATATLTVTGSQLPAGANITATYSDQNVYAALQVSALSHSSNSVPSIAGVTNGASFKPGFTPGSLISVFGSQLAQSTEVAGSIPLPVSVTGVTVTVNGVVAPLYYSSPGQLNLQIPYETPAGTDATLTVNNYGQTASQQIPIASAAPGIFADATLTLVPYGSASRGQTIPLFITGGGGVSPAVSTGGTPSAQTATAALPRLTQNVGVTVGGMSAPIQFSGVAPGLVGVVQINFQIPSGAPLGGQQVVVTVGNVASPPVTLNLSN
jgi:uncharacterized protein (TIGR03437 family)